MTPTPEQVARWREHWNAQGIKPTERQARLVRETFRNTASAPR